MYNSNPRGQFSSPTVLGIPERWERVLCYVLGWVTGLIFLLIEQRNQTVRRHAMQSLVVFGGLSILGFVLGILSHIWVIGAIFGLLAGLLGTVGFFLWIVLMILAFVSPATFVNPSSSRYV